MDLAVSSKRNESVVALAWLENALEHAYAHGQMQTLAYLEWVMEDVVFVMEINNQHRAIGYTHPRLHSTAAKRNVANKTW